MEIPAFIKGQDLFLPIPDVFNFLKIQYTPSPTFDSISGFFFSQQDLYLIDQENNEIRYQGKVHDLEPDDFIRTEDNLYMRIKYFGQIFGLECIFEFRTLSVNLKTKLELPVIRQMRQELMRKNIYRLKGEIKADTFIFRKYPGFHFGMADWSVIATERQPGFSDVRINLALGSVIAGGEADLSLSYSNIEPFIERNQRYLWHFADNNYNVVKQVFLGKVPVQSIASIYYPVLGGIVTNTPTIYRQTFGSYTLVDHTEPGWIVELYINSVLVDYVKADASGFFTFEVPLVYGNSVVKLHFYGPWGEERSREQSISIPFNFLPQGKLEYTITGGIVEDWLNSRFSRANLNYGLSKRLTVGTGVEYLSSIPGRKTLPFLNLSLRVGSGMMITGEYTYGVRFKGFMSYRLPSDLQFELNYSKYDPNQKAINYTNLEERKAVVSMPLRLKGLSTLLRLTVDQIILSRSNYITTEFLISGNVFGLSANFTTNAVFMNPYVPYVYSTVSLGFRLPAGFIFTPQTQYVYNLGKIISLKLQVEKRLLRHGYMNIIYERNLAVNIDNFQIGMRYELPFAQAGFTASHGNGVNTLFESARGSLIYDAKTNYVGANIRPGVGKSGIVILPFLDLNCNGRRDKEEPKVDGLTVRINGGRIEQSKRDTLIRIFDLESFANYLIELNKQSFDNVAWQIRKKTISVSTDPNMFKLVEVPVAVYGEATGMVYLNGSNGQNGQGRIIIDFYKSDSTYIARTLSEPDGYYSFLGFSPGTYFARIDEKQMKKLHMTSSPAFQPFTIERMVDGDQAQGLEFVLNYEPTDSTSATHYQIEVLTPIPMDGIFRQLYEDIPVMIKPLNAIPDQKEQQQAPSLAPIPSQSPKTSVPDTLMTPAKKEVE